MAAAALILILGRIAQAPGPAAGSVPDTSKARLRPMHSRGRDCDAEDRFETPTWHHLRLSSRPLARNGWAGATSPVGPASASSPGSSPRPS